MNYTVSELHTYITRKDKNAIKVLLDEGLIEIKDGRLFTTKKAKDLVEIASSFWDQRQLARKILLNSLN